MNNSRVRFCIPCLADDVEGVCDFIDAQDATAQDSHLWIEVWLDLITDLNATNAAKIFDKIDGRGIVVFRRPQLAPIKMSRELRNDLILEISRRDLLLDLDLLTQRDDLAEVRALAPSQQLILSHHNYQATPASDELSAIAAQLEAESPTIVKISTFCHTPDDALRLLTLLRSLTLRGIRSVILGMGQHGIAIRIVGSYWGNEFLFVPPLNGIASAPGQLTHPEADKIFSIINSAAERSRHEK